MAEEKYRQNEKPKDLKVQKIYDELGETTKIMQKNMVLYSRA